MNEHAYRPIKTLLHEFETGTFETPVVNFEDNTIRQIAKLRGNKLYIYAEKKNATDGAEAPIIVATYKISDDGESLFIETRESYDAQKRFLNRIEFKDVDNKPDLTHALSTNAEGISKKSTIPKSVLVNAFGQQLEYARYNYDKIAKQLETPLASLDITADNTVQLEDGSIISALGDEVRVNTDPKNTTISYIFKISDDGETITPVGAEIFAKAQEGGIPTGGISYKYSTENGVDIVTETMSHIGKGDILPLNLSKQKDRSTLDEELAPITARVRGYLDTLSVEEKSAMCRPPNMTVDTTSSFSKRLMAQIGTERQQQ